MSYTSEVFEKVVKENPAELEFQQAVKEVFSTIGPAVEKKEKL